MLKAVVRTQQGRKVLILGLEEGHLQRLRQGFPIHLHGEDVEIAGLEVTIFCCRDADELGRAIEDLIVPDTRELDPSPRQ